MDGSKAASTRVKTLWRSSDDDGPEIAGFALANKHDIQSPFSASLVLSVPRCERVYTFGLKPLPPKNGRKSIYWVAEHVTC